jgi:hypothetical protein
LVVVGLAALTAVGWSAMTDDQHYRPVSAAAGPNLVHIADLAFDGTPEPLPTPTPTPTPPQPRSVSGLRVWSDGDSTSYFMTVAMYAITAELGGTPVMPAEYKISSGLLNRAFFDWPAYVAGQMAAYDPDLVVFMLGANDAMQISSYDDYAARVGQVMDLMYRPGRTVLWLGQPNMQPNPDLGYNPALVTRIPPLNEVFRTEAAKRSWVIYVDTWAVTSWSDGTYAPSLPDENGVDQPLRAADGIHFTPAGGRRLALAALAAFTR